jgi:hypothetical protein
MDKFKLKQIGLFSLVVAVLIGFIAGGIYLMIALGDAIPIMVDTLQSLAEEMVK